MQCMQRVAGSTAKFLVIGAGGGYVVLKGGDQTCAGQGGKRMPCTAQHGASRGATRLKPTTISQGKIALRTAQGGRYVSIGSDGVATVGPTTVGKTETLAFTCIKGCSGGSEALGDGPLGEAILGSHPGGWFVAAGPA